MAFQVCKQWNRYLLLTRERQAVAPAYVVRSRNYILEIMAEKYVI
jgi:hypothetical protein